MMAQYDAEPNGWGRRPSQRPLGDWKHDRPSILTTGNGYCHRPQVTPVAHRVASHKRRLHRLRALFAPIKKNQSIAGLGWVLKALRGPGRRNGRSDASALMRVGHRLTNRSRSHKKTPNHLWLGVGIKSLTMTYSHMGRPHTTIGEAAFHF